MAIKPIDLADFDDDDEPPQPPLQHRPGIAARAAGRL
jgi:hypothetical protein